MKMTPTYCMAPIRGLTDLAYRNAFADLFQGVDFAMTPFVQTVKGNQDKPVHLLENAPTENSLPLVPQIIGKNPDHFLDLARQLSEVGNRSVNWNLGCPFPTQTTKRCGSGLLLFPEEIDRFLDHVSSTLPVSLSIKMRLGLEDPNEIMSVIPVLNRYPLEHVTIHPRLGTQMYGGTVDLDCFALCCDKLKHPVMYNGDITTIEQHAELQQRFPNVTMWMLGRGLLANPCLAEEIRQGIACSQAERTRRIRALHAALFDGYSQRLSGPAHLIQRMVSHWEYLHVSLPFGERLYHKVRKARTVAQYQTVIGRAFDSGA